MCHWKGREMAQVFGTIPPPLLYRDQTDTVGTARSTDSNPRIFSPLFHALYFVFYYIKPRSLIFQDLKKALWRQGLLLKRTQPFCFSCTKSAAALFILVCPWQHVAQNRIGEHCVKPRHLCGTITQKLETNPGGAAPRMESSALLRLRPGVWVGYWFSRQTSSLDTTCPWNSSRLAQDKSPFCCFSGKDLPGETGHEWRPYTAFERYHCKKISSHVQRKLWVQFLSFALISSFC